MLATVFGTNTVPEAMSIYTQLKVLRVRVGLFVIIQIEVRMHAR